MVDQALLCRHAVGSSEPEVEPEAPMLPSARSFRDFPQQRFAGEAHGAPARLGNAADRLLARALEALHDWQIRQAACEIRRYRKLVRSNSN
jgi:hypothetical protein